jgi:hypothetical protein
MAAMKITRASKMLALSVAVKANRNNDGQVQ